MPGAGKSTLGPLLAKDLSLEIEDLDKLINKKTKISMNEFIEKNGEDKLLKLEEELTLPLDLKGKMFIPGGSIIYSKKAMKKLKKETFIIHLKVPREILKSRLKNIDIRGIIGLKRYGFDKLFDMRSILYEKYADAVVLVNNETEDEIRRILKKTIYNLF